MLRSILSRLPARRPISRRRRAFQLLVAATLLPATALGPAALQADGAEKPFRIPLHTEPAKAWLLGASSVGVAVAQSVPGSKNSQGTVYSGAWDERFLPRGEAVAPGSRGAGMSGSTLAYTVGHPDAATPWTEPRHLNVLTGEDVSAPVEGTKVSDPVYTGNGWIAEDVPAGLNGNLRWYPADASASRVVWSPDGKQLTGFDAEGTGLLVAYATYQAGDDFWKPTGPHRLDLIDLETGSVQRIASATAPIADPKLSAGRAVWITGARVLNSAARTGQAGPSFTETDASARLSGAAVAQDGTIGYLTAKDSVLRLVKNGKSTDVRIPTGSGGLDTVGNDFYTAGGYGISRIRSGHSQRVRALPRPEHEVLNWDFDHGVLRYLDRSGAEGDQMSLWTRRVDAQAKESATRVRVLSEKPQLSFDAGRGALPSQKHLLTWDLLDRNRRTGVAVEQTPVPGTDGRLVHQAAEPVVSGPYVLVNGLVHRSDGELVFTEPDPARRAGQDAIFGSRLVYGMTSDGGEAEVWSVDVETPEPARLASTPCDRAPETAVWGGLSAWTSCDAQEITIGRAVGGGTPRTVSSGLTGEPAQLGLTMNATTVGWVANRTAYVLDLASPTSSPIALAGDTRRMVIDGGRVVREVYRDNTVPATVLQAEQLPFAVKVVPRLTGRVAPISFTPDGDGRNDTWAPQFDASSPLATASIRLVSGRSGKPVRTLTTTRVSDGSVRMSWTGRTGSGKKAAKGPYRYTLTAADASGARITSSGTVWINP